MFSGFVGRHNRDDLLQAVDHNLAATKEHGIARRVKSEVDAASMNRAAGITGDRIAVAGNIQPRTERNDAWIHGDDAVTGRSSDRRHAAAATATRSVRGSDHIERRFSDVCRLLDSMARKLCECFVFAGSDCNHTSMRVLYDARRNNRFFDGTTVALRESNHDIAFARIAWCKNSRRSRCKRKVQPMLDVRSDALSFGAIPRNDAQDANRAAVAYRVR